MYKYIYILVNGLLLLLIINLLIIIYWSIFRMNENLLTLTL